MGLPRTFIGFSSTDLQAYNFMLGWKANERIDFDFADCQLAKEIHSSDEDYIKRRCRERIGLAGTFISLIGEDTSSKHKYVRWELEIAIEKGCRMVAVNLDKARRRTNKCPPILRDAHAVFVPYSPKIIAYALEGFVPGSEAWYYYPDSVYQKLGYSE